MSEQKNKDLNIKRFIDWMHEDLRKELLEKLIHGMKSVEDLMYYSHGVYGLHHEDKSAEWSQLTEHEDSLLIPFNDGVILFNEDFQNNDVTKAVPARRR